uniref:Expressed protein n=1 Tax=Oryza sativa subsp. japonica TaxID=39947 RepID=Q2QVC6_ORYSJ|nr:expressed protein [Oryza sativa Japonica Group]
MAKQQPVLIRLLQCRNMAEHYHELEKDLKLHDVLLLLQILPAVRQDLGWIRLYINNAADQDNTQLLHQQWNAQLAINPPAKDLQHILFLTYLPRGPGNQQKVLRETFNNHKWELKEKIKSNNTSHVDICKLLYAKKNKSQKDDVDATFKLNMIELSLSEDPNSLPCIALCLVYQSNKSPMLYLIQSLVHRLQIQVRPSAQIEQKKIVKNSTLIINWHTLSDADNGKYSEDEDDYKRSHKYLMKGKYKVVDEHSYNNIQSAITLRDTIVRRLDTWLQQHQDIASTIEALLPFQNDLDDFILEKMNDMLSVVHRMLVKRKGTLKGSQVFEENKRACLRQEPAIESSQIKDFSNLDIFTTTKHQILNTSQVSQNEAVITQQSQSAVPVDMKQYDFYARNQQQFPVNLPDFRPEALNALYVLQTGEVITIHGQSQRYPQASSIPINEAQQGEALQCLEQAWLEEVIKFPEFKELLKSFSKYDDQENDFPSEMRINELPSSPSVMAAYNSQDEILDPEVPPLLGSFAVKLTETEPLDSYNDLKGHFEDIENWEAS